MDTWDKRFAEAAHIQSREATAVSREEQLKDALVRFELVSRGSSEGHYDAHLPEDGKMHMKLPVWWSQQFRHLLGYTDEHDFPSFLGSWISIVHPEDREPVFKALSSHVNDLTDRTPYATEYRMQTRTQGYRWFSSNGKTLRGPGGKPMRIAGSFRDIDYTKTQDLRIRKTLAALQSAVATVSSQVTALQHSSAEDVGKVVSRSQVLMRLGQDIQRSVGKIASIAQTTNILSINAKLEAAHAGSAGRGFDVVADEVRRLSDHTSEVTDEVRLAVVALCDGIGETAQASDRFRDMTAQINEIQVRLTRVIEEEASELANGEGPAWKESGSAPAALPGGHAGRSVHSGGGAAAGQLQMRG